MAKKTLRDIDLNGKRVVMRVDFNVPMAKDGSGTITDDTRVQAALPSIKYVLENGASLVLMSHLGRPKGKGYEAEFSLKPVAEHLAKLLGKPVAFAPDCMAADAGKKEAAEKEFKTFVSGLDKAVKKGIISKNTADRKKSRAQLKMNKMAAAAEAAK